MSPRQEDILTDDQAAVYDRQLRVWGVETQRKWDTAAAAHKQQQIYVTHANQRASLQTDSRSSVACGIRQACSRGK